MPTPVTPATARSIPPESSIVVLTGAGISKESGLDTFRDAGGIWRRVSLEEVATPEGFRADPAKVHAFYNARRQALQVADVQPNAAHHALARLEREWPGEVLLVTQNVDDLHERAGSRALLHMHGELLKARCEACGAVHPWHRDLGLDDACPACATVGRLRPNVVWFNEIPMELDRIYAALEACGLFIAIGTSGTVYPAAGFVHAVLDRGSAAHTVELNLDPSHASSLFAEAIHGPATRVVPAYVARLLADAGAPAEGSGA